MSNGAQAAGTSANYRVVRELGNRSQKTFAAVRERTELVVLHRWVKTANGEPPAKGVSLTNENGATRVSAEQMALLLRDAKCLAKNWHPNVARVRHVDVIGSELNVATELVDGATLEELFTAARAKRTKPTEPLIPHAILARILVDVLGGLHGLHGLRDGIQSSLGCFHGETAPANIVVGKDGVARIVNCFRPRPVKITAQSEALGYASPETLAGESTQDVRSDLFGVGVMLWEALVGERLYPEMDPARIAQRQREEDLEPPKIADASPFAKLPEIAMRALAFDPALRFRTASEMATEIRRVAGTRLAPGSAVAQCVMELAGDRVKNRRADLDPSSSGSRKRASKAPEPTPAGSIATVIGVPAITIPKTPGAPDVDFGDRPTLEPSSSPAPHQMVVETKDVFVPAKIGPVIPKVEPKKELPKPPAAKVSKPPAPKPAPAPPPAKPKAEPISDASALEAAMDIRVSPRSLLATPEAKEAPEKKASAPPPPITPEPSVVVAPPSDPAIELLSSASVQIVPDAQSDLVPPSEPNIELPPPTDPRMVEVSAVDRNTPDELSVSVPPPNRRKFLPLVLGVVSACAVATIVSALLFSPSKDTPAPPKANATTTAAPPPPEPPPPTAITPPATTTAAPEEPKPVAKEEPPPTVATTEPPRPAQTTTPPAAPPAAPNPPRNSTPAARPPAKKKTFDPTGI